MDETQDTRLLSRRQREEARKQRHIAAVELGHLLNIPRKEDIIEQFRDCPRRIHATLSDPCND